jgi:hypothetical protein
LALSVTAGPKVCVMYPTATASVGIVDPLESELPELELLELLEALVLAAVTTIEKAGSAIVVVPSLAEAIIGSLFAVCAVRSPEDSPVAELKLTEMMILAYVPAFAAVGLPESSPVLKLKLAQTGWFWILKLTESPVGMATVGVKL